MSAVRPLLNIERELPTTIDDIIVICYTIHPARYPYNFCDVKLIEVAIIYPEMAWSSSVIAVEYKRSIYAKRTASWRRRTDIARSKGDSAEPTSLTRVQRRPK